MLRPAGRSISPAVCLHIMALLLEAIAHSAGQKRFFTMLRSFKMTV